MKQRFETLDVWLAAYLQLYYQPPEFEVKSGRVVFVFPITDDLYRTIADFNGNVKTPIGSYINIVKNLRGQMFSARGK